jgi:benzodiazapine receptor
MGWRPFLAAGSATVAAAAIGGAGTDVTSPWYRKLDLPRWQPPGQVIGVVWAVL